MSYTSHTVIRILQGSYKGVGMRGLLFGQMSGQQSFRITGERLFTGDFFYSRSLQTEDCCHWYYYY